MFTESFRQQIKRRHPPEMHVVCAAPIADDILRLDGRQQTFNRRFISDCLWLMTSGRRCLTAYAALHSCRRNWYGACVVRGVMSSRVRRSVGRVANVYNGNVSLSVANRKVVVECWICRWEGVGREGRGEEGGLGTGTERRMHVRTNWSSKSRAKETVKGISGWNKLMENRRKEKVKGKSGWNKLMKTEMKSKEQSQEKTNENYTIDFRKGYSRWKNK